MAWIFKRRSRRRNETMCSVTFFVMRIPPSVAPLPSGSKAATTGEDVEEALMMLGAGSGRWRWISTFHVLLCTSNGAEVHMPYITTYIQKTIQQLHLQRRRLRQYICTRLRFPTLLRHAH